MAGGSAGSMLRPKLTTAAVLLMTEPAQASSVTAEILGALPQAVDPFALSLNENPFPSLPTVRSALVRSIDAANRYPEFLPGQLRRLVANRVGVRDEQVVLGAGASGVVMQILHAVTLPVTGLC